MNRIKRSKALQKIIKKLWWGIPNARATPKRP